MKRISFGARAAVRASLFCALFCAANYTARAQFVGYSTNFDSTDTVNGKPAPNFTPYTSPNQPVDSLEGQNGWASTDPVGATGANQVNGGTDYVGAFGSFFGSTFAGAIGGNQRNATPSASVPDVVPSTGSGGNVSLYHSLSTNSSSFALDVDLVLTSSSSAFNTADSFAFSLRNTAGTATLISINFTPAPAGSPAADNVTTTVGTKSNVSTGAALVLNSQYHFHLVLTLGRNGTFSGSFTDPSSGSSAGSFNGSLNTSALTLADVGRFSADWSLTNKATNSGGGLTGAGDNTLAFDNLVVTVPEPSVYAIVACGLLGMVGARRMSRRHA